jgi:hypothetical protein
MSRGRRGRGGGDRYDSAKAGAGGGGLTDADVIGGNLADASARKMTNNEAYWWLFKKHPWVRACVRIKGNAVAQEGHDFVPNDDDDPLDKNDENVQLMQTFLRVAFIGKCNTFRKFRKSIVMDGEIYSVAYAHKKFAQVKGVKTLVGLERMNPLRITPHLNADKTAIDYYAIKKSTSAIDSIVAQAAQQATPVDSRDAIRIPAEEMVVFTADEGGDDILPSPSPLEALDQTAATDFGVREHRRKFFSSGTTTGNVLTLEEGKDEDVRDAQKKLKLQAGSNNAFRNIAISGKWKLLSLLQSGGRDFDFIKGSELTIEEVCAVYGVPPSKLRDVSGSMGQAGKGEDDDTFEQECILPIEENFYETLTIELLQKEFGIEYFSFAPKRRSKVRLDRFAAAVQLVKFGGTGNDARDLVGLPKIDDPNMDIPLFLGATGQAGVSSDEIDPPTDPQQPAPGNADVTDPADMNDENQPGNKTGAKKAGRFGRQWY